jgi:hypothetical protein
MQPDLAAQLAHLEDMVEMYEDHINGLENVLRRTEAALEEAQRQRYKFLRRPVDYFDIIVKAVDLHQPHLDDE